MIKTLHKHIHEFFRDVTAMGGFAASLLLMLIFLGSPLFLPLLLGSILTAGIVIIIRILYFKNRPKKELYKNWMERIDASSFPSLHTARIVFLALLFTFFVHNYYLALLCAIIAVLVSYSRIYLKKHDWIDVIGGAMLGAIAYFIIITLF